MKGILMVLAGISLTAVCWGSYGTFLHKGQDGFHDGTQGDRLKPLICVGLAYLIVAIIVPVLLLASSGRLAIGWFPEGKGISGTTWSMVAGTTGAVGALGIIMALSAGGKWAPIYVMPIVFGAAPIINVFVTMWFSKIPLRQFSPFFIAGLILVSAGAITVLVFKPRPPEGAHAEQAVAELPQDEHATEVSPLEDTQRDVP